VRTTSSTARPAAGSLADADDVGSREEDGSMYLYLRDAITARDRGAAHDELPVRRRDGAESYYRWAAPSMRRGTVGRPP
jgi:hypothetical protein